MTITRSASLLCCASLLAVSSGAFAQGQPAADENASGSDPIIVTGSRVVLNGNDSPTPVTVADISKMAELHPGTVADQLNDLPQLSLSQNQNNGQGGGSANAGNSNPTGNVLNLRNFGQVRTLILYDGHRVAPNSGNGTVDIDMIPQLLLKRVDLATGGVSAVYGADAVTGVVNFITDTKFNGVKANGSYGVSTHGDGRQKDLGVAWGGNLGDRGHLLLSYQFRSDDGISNRTSRAWGALRQQMAQVGGTVSGVNTFKYITGAARLQNSFGGTINPFAGGGTLPASILNNVNGTNLLSYFSAPGVLSPASGTFVNNNNVENGSGGFFDTSLRAALKMHQVFGRLDYDVSDSVHFYARGAYTNTRNEGFGIPNPSWTPNGNNFAPVSVGNPYLPAALASQLTAAGVTVFQLGKLYGGPTMNQYRQFTQTYGRNWSADIGLNGDFGGWKWETSFIHSDNNQRTRANNAVNGRKSVASLDAVNDAGTIKCWVNTAAGQTALNASANAAALKSFYSGCVPQATAFGGVLTPTEADWIFDPMEVTTKIRQDDFEAYVSGSPFSTWAGPVQLALSGQLRKQSYQVISSSSPATLANPVDCTGLRLLTGGLACGAGSLEYFQAESYSRPQISVSTKEVAVEANIPLLKDSAIGRDLSLLTAARYTDYSTTGGIWSWKAGVNWQITDDLSFRATRSRDIRAPTLHELFQPQIISTFNALDVLLGKNFTTAPLTPATVIAQGNANLKPEKADGLTLGLVYQPAGIPGLSLAIDYFDIKVKDAILTLAGTDVSSQTDCIASGGKSTVCSLIVRPIDCCTTKTDANAATRFYTSPVNVARQYTRGVDMELNYTSQMFKRPFNLRLLTTYQPNNVYIDGITGVKTENAGSAIAFGANSNIGAGAKWRGTFQFSMDVTDSLKFSLQERYRGPMNFVPVQTASATTTVVQYVLQNAPVNIPARVYTNLNIGYKVGPGEIFANVQNLFNTQPAPFASVNSGLPGNNNVAPGDDPIGRYFTFGFRTKF